MEQQVNNDGVICISKRHWIVYILPGILIFFGLSALLDLKVVSFVIGLGLILFGVQRFLAHRNTSWVLTEDVLTIRSGFILGTVYYEIPNEDIYECYCIRGILGSILGYGTLVVKRTDGLSTEFSTKQMANINEMMMTINALVKNRKTQPNASQQQNNFVADELQKLMELKDKGILTEEEFNIQKQKLINK